MNTIQISIPLITKDDIIQISAGIRPYRIGGSRQEEQQIGDKIIYHNYGHGGCGVSLSYGSTKLLTDQMINKYPQKNIPIAILGSGYIGLFTAIHLTKNGYKVKVYSKDFPHLDKIRSHGYNLASEAAAGLWMTLGYEFEANNLAQINFLNEAAKMTYDYFQNQMNTNISSGLQNIECVQIYEDQNKGIEDIKKSSLYSIQYKEGLIQVNGGRFHKCFIYQSMMIEGQVIIKNLFEQCKQLGVEFICKDFSNREEIINIKEKIIFNCLGFGAGKVFDDKNIIPKKGQIIWIKPIEGFNYHISYLKNNNIQVDTYPLQNKLGIGKIVEINPDNKPQIENTQTLFNNYNNMVLDLQQQKQRPKL